VRTKREILAVIRLMAEASLRCSSMVVVQEKAPLSYPGQASWRRWRAMRRDSISAAKDCASLALDPAEERGTGEGVAPEIDPGQAAECRSGSSITWPSSSR